MLPTMTYIGEVVWVVGNVAILDMHQLLVEYSCWGPYRVCINHVPRRGGLGVSSQIVVTFGVDILGLSAISELISPSSFPQARGSVWDNVHSQHESKVPADCKCLPSLPDNPTTKGSLHALALVVNRE